MADTQRDRVYRIACRIAAGEWNRATEKEWAEEWGLSRVTVRHLAAEASRVVDICTNDRAKLIQVSRVRLAQIASEDAPDRVQAIKVQFEHLGELRKKLEVTGSDGGEIGMGVVARVVVLPAEKEDG